MISDSAAIAMTLFVLLVVFYLIVGLIIGRPMP